MIPRHVVLAGLALGLAGCNRQDTECLARLGRKLLDRTQGATQEIRDRLDLGRLAPEPGPVDRVRQRLRADKALAETAIEVHGTDGALELKGAVQTAAQRQRAVDLAESTVGVERVTDGLQVSEP